MGQPPPAVIKNRPVYPPEKPISDQEVRDDMAAIDQQIDDLLNRRAALQKKVDNQSKEADEIMNDAWERYNQAISEQQKSQADLQKLDDDVQALVKKKSKLVEKLKK